MPAKIATPRIIPVVLCGGSGTRLWPASRENHPKQFLSLTNDFSLLQNTIRRAMRTSKAAASSLICVTLESMKDGVNEHLAEIDVAGAVHVLSEPVARNTAAAIAYAARYVAATFGEDAILWVLPSDHHIEEEDILALALEKAAAAATQGYMITFGITPTRADTGYGYIRVGDMHQDFSGVHSVGHFREKPDAATTQTYIENGDYLWNSGMFLFTAASVLQQYEQHAPAILEIVDAAMEKSMTDPCPYTYAAIAAQPFDKAVMEKSASVAVVPCDPGWTDIGSWESLWDLRKKDMNNNVVEGRAATQNAHGCFIQGNGRLIAVAGLDDIVVIETDDAILIGNKNDSSSMKKLVSRLKKMGVPETINLAQETDDAQQPWTLIKKIEHTERLPENPVLHAPLKNH